MSDATLRLVAGGRAPRGWEELWAHDRWRHEELPHGDLSIVRSGALRFDRFAQPWLKEAAKRWVRARLLGSTSTETMLRYLLDLEKFSGWLAEHAPEVASPAQLDRELLEDYLLWLRTSRWSASTRRRLVSALRQFLWEHVELMYRSPVDLYLDEWFYDLLDVIERTGARRIFIDSLGDLRRAAIDELRFREYLYSLLQRSSNQQISVMMSQETPGLFGISQLSDDGISHLSDNVILLQFVHHTAQLKRAVTVLKTRASRHEPDVREFNITPEGIVLGEPISNPTR